MASPLSVTEPRANLTNLRIDEIAFVDEGANPGARILFFKRKHPQHLDGARPFSKRVAITKIDEEQRIVYGWASIIEYHGEPVSDWEGDVISEAELEKAAHTYASESRGSTLMHEQPGVAHMVASLCFTRKVQQALGVDLDLVGWLVGFEVRDDEVWEAVKLGKLRMFSIGGIADSATINGPASALPVGKIFTASTSLVAGHGHVVGLPAGGFGPGTYLTNPGDVDQHTHTLKVPSAVRVGSSLTLMTECGGADAHQHEVFVTVPAVVEQRRSLRREMLGKLRALLGKAAPTVEQVAVAEEITKQDDEYVPRSYAEVRDDRLAFGVGDALDDRVYALSQAFYEIVTSGETDKEARLLASLAEFATMTERDIPRLLSGEIAKTFTELSTPPADAAAVQKLLTEKLSKIESEKGSPTMEPTTFDLSKLSPEHRAMVEPVVRKLWETAATRGTELDAIKKTAPPPPPDSPADTVLKALPKDVATAIEPILKGFEARTAAAEAKTETVSKAFDTFQKAQRKAEIRKAAEGLRFVEGSVDEHAATLEKADIGGCYSEVLKSLQAANDVVEKSGVFSEIGSAGGGAGAGADAHSKVSQIAKALFEKDTSGTMTPEVAYVKALEMNPGLADEIRDDETRARRGN